MGIFRKDPVSGLETGLLYSTATILNASGGGSVPNASVYGQYPYWNSYTNSWQIGGSGSVALGASAGLTGQQTGAIAIGINAGSIVEEQRPWP
jgi:hypothetical protein